ncbi:MAG: YceH family protein [Solirubrobacterales bacterium]
MEPDAVEIRVAGCLVEKQRTTPDAYPLSLNALRLACNQSTNRDPVVDYDEATVSDALRRLALRGWTRLASGAGSRARKYRHLLPEALGAEGGELALLAVLMLRGPQTPGELKQRSERLHWFADLAAVQETLERLLEREYVVRHPRRPGQKEDRYQQVLGGEEALPSAPEQPTGEAAPPTGPAAASGSKHPGRSSAAASADDETPADEDRLERLERDLAALRAEVSDLRRALGEES